MILVCLVFLVNPKVQYRLSDLVDQGLHYCLLGQVVPVGQAGLVILQNQCHPLIPVVLLDQLVLRVLAVQKHLEILADLDLPCLLAVQSDLWGLVILENPLVLAVLVVQMVRVVRLNLFLQIHQVGQRNRKHLEVLAVQLVQMDLCYLVVLEVQKAHVGPAGQEIQHHLGVQHHHEDPSLQQNQGYQESQWLLELPVIQESQFHRLDLQDQQVQQAQEDREVHLVLENLVAQQLLKLHSDLVCQMLLLPLVTLESLERPLVLKDQVAQMAPEVLAVLHLLSVLDLVNLQVLWDQEVQYLLPDLFDLMYLVSLAGQHFHWVQEVLLNL